MIRILGLVTALAAFTWGGSKLVSYAWAQGTSSPGSPARSVADIVTDFGLTGGGSTGSNMAADPATAPQQFRKASEVLMESLREREKALNEREQKLGDREKAVAERETAVKQLEGELEQRVARAEQTVEQLENRVKELNGAWMTRQQKIDTLVTTIGSLPARQAAPILAATEKELATAILLKLGPQKSGQLLGQMEPAMAGGLVQELLKLSMTQFDSPETTTEEE